MEISSNLELIKKVETALDEIRPFLQEDGGDITVKSVSDDGVATVEFLGACTSCSMSNMTFKAGVEEAILNSVPEIKKVLAENLSAKV